MNKHKIVIDSSSRIFYASFYIYGLIEVFGKQNVSFSSKEFQKLKRNEKEFAFEHYFAFLIKNSNENYAKEFSDLLFFKHYQAIDYVINTKKSKFVFNTPAVYKCHGWKLGEYLAMGKAIVSTPLTNDLPFSLEHKKNIHFISNENQLNDAIQILLENTYYLNYLE